MLLIKARPRWLRITHIDGKYYNFCRKYYISNYGEVLSADHGSKRILKQQVRDKYFRTSLFYITEQGDRKKKTITVHRLVCEYFGKYDEWLPKYEVHHKDGDHHNNFYKNLELLDPITHARLTESLKQISHAKGEYNGLSKLTDTLVDMMYRDMLSGMNNKDIRKKYNITKEDFTHTSMKRLRDGDVYKSITSKYNKIPNKSKKTGVLPSFIINKMRTMFLTEADNNKIASRLNIYEYYPNTSTESVRKLICAIRRGDLYKNIV